LNLIKAPLQVVDIQVSFGRRKGANLLLAGSRQERRYYEDISDSVIEENNPEGKKQMFFAVQLRLAGFQFVPPSLINRR